MGSERTRVEGRWMWIVGGRVWDLTVRHRHLHLRQDLYRHWEVISILIAGREKSRLSLI